MLTVGFFSLFIIDNLLGNSKKHGYTVVHAHTAQLNVSQMKYDIKHTIS